MELDFLQDEPKLILTYPYKFKFNMIGYLSMIFSFFIIMSILIHLKSYGSDFADKFIIATVLICIPILIFFMGYYLFINAVKLELYENNVVKVTKLLDQMVESGVKNFIFSSTAATFGEPVKEKIDETHQQLPINPYGKSKLMVEKILEDYDAAYGLKSVVLRYFNASGSDKDGIIGESHIPETHLIPLILQAASGKRESIKIFGDDYPTKDGTCIRDFVHVYDLAKAHILGMEKMLKENKSLNYNLGSGEGFSVKEVIEKVKEVTGKDFKVETVEKRAGDPAILVANSEKAKKELGWEPEYSLEEIIDSAWKWENSRKY